MRLSFKNVYLPLTLALFLSANFGNVYASGPMTEEEDTVCCGCLGSVSRSTVADLAFVSIDKGLGFLDQSKLATGKYSEEVRIAFGFIRDAAEIARDSIRMVEEIPPTDKEGRLNRGMQIALGKMQELVRRMSNDEYDNLDDSLEGIATNLEAMILAVMDKKDFSSKMIALGATGIEFVDSVWDLVEKVKAYQEVADSPQAVSFMNKGQESLSKAKKTLMKSTRSTERLQEAAKSTLLRKGKSLAQARFAGLDEPEERPGARMASGSSKSRTVRKKKKSRRQPSVGALELEG